MGIQGMLTSKFEGPRHTPPERRTASRVIMDLPVAVLSEGFRHECRTVDLSLTGMVVDLSQALRQREAHLVYTYEIGLARGRVVTITGRTAWRRGGLQGVRFVVVDEGDRRELAALIEAARQERTGDLERLERAEQLDLLRAHAKPSAA